jgi:hypothetical protein
MSRVPGFGALARCSRWWRQAKLWERAGAVACCAAVGGVFAVFALGGGGRPVAAGAQAHPVPGAALESRLGAHQGNAGGRAGYRGRVHLRRGAHAAHGARAVSPPSAVAGSPAPTGTPGGRTLTQIAQTDPGIIGVVVGHHGTRSGGASHRGGPTRVSAAPAALAPLAVEVDYQDAGAANSFFAQYGANAAAADPGAQAQATADWINQHGGLLGHRLTLRLRHYDFYRDRLSVLDQVTCDDAASAPRALAEVDRHASTDILIPCLAKKGIPSIVDTETDPALGDYRKWPGLLFSPGSAAVDRPQAAFVAGLRQAGFFASGRVGILEAEGLPQFDDATAALKQALAAAGVQPVADAVVSTEDPASFFATESSAELKLRLARVQRVVVFDYDGIVAGQFMRVAAVQGYQPQFGLNSIASPQFLADQAPTIELRGAVGIGWSPLVDVSPAFDPSAGNPARAVCDQAFAAEHVATGGRTPFGQYTAYQTCTDLLSVQAAVTAGGAATPAGLAAGMARLQSVLPSPLTLVSTLDASRADGASAWRALRYHDDCRCFQYEGPLNGM